MPSSPTPGSSTSISRNFDVDIGLRRMTTGSALPTLPPSVAGGRSIAWLHWFASATACQVARPLYGSDWKAQPSGTFTSRLSTDRSPSPLLDITTTATGLLVWGFFCQEVSAERVHLFSFVSFFVCSESPFLPPAPPRRHHANTVGLGQQNDDQRGARVRARIYRATTLYSVGPRTRTMMQSYASVAKLRSGGPILCYGVISHGVHRVTATSNRHRRPVTSRRAGPKLLGAFCVLPSLCGTQNRSEERRVGK